MIPKAMGVSSKSTFRNYSHIFATLKSAQLGKNMPCPKGEPLATVMPQLFPKEGVVVAPGDFQSIEAYMHVGQ